MARFVISGVESSASATKLLVCNAPITLCSGLNYQRKERRVCVWNYKLDYVLRNGTHEVMFSDILESLMFDIPV
jgi:hypothetical protein